MNFPKLLASGLLLTCLPAGMSYAGIASGEDVAAALNSRYEKVVTDCDGDPASYCSGVVIRTNETNGKYPTWKPYLPYLKEDVNDKSLQFSYLRKDMGLHDYTIWDFNKTGYGILLKSGGADSFKSRCIYPVNATSAQRKTYGCGALKATNKLHDEDEDNSTCESKGVLTSDDWISEYGSGGVGDFCSFSSHKAKYFKASVEASIKIFNKYKYVDINNEIIVNTAPPFWDVNDPSKDHIQALWYNPEAGEVGLTGAQKEQQMYYDISGKWIPIISIKRINDNAVFSYSEDTQKVKPAS